MNPEPFDVAKLDAACDRLTTNTYLLQLHAEIEALKERLDVLERGQNDQLKHETNLALAEIRSRFSRIEKGFVQCLQQEVNPELIALKERLDACEHIAEQGHRLANLALQCSQEDEPRLERIEDGINALAVWVHDIEQGRAAQ